MDLKPAYLAAAYLAGLVLIAAGVGFFDWRLGLVCLGLGIAGPVVALPNERAKP